MKSKTTGKKQFWVRTLCIVLAVLLAGSSIVSLIIIMGLFS